MKKILVTGGAGYIGSHTAVALCEAGYLPVVVDNFCASDRRMLGRMEKLMGRTFATYEIDCRDRVALRNVFETEKDIYGVIHFAAHKSVGVSVREPREYYDNNLGSLLAVLDVMAGRNASRLVFSSSCTVYGQPDILPVNEQTPLKRAESPYGRTKQMCESLLDDVVSSGASLEAVTLRYFNPIGAHPSGLIGELPLGKPETLVPYITQSAAGLRAPLTVFGDDYPTEDGSCVRDYIHIQDLANAHVAALGWLERQSRGPFNEIFNVGTGRGVSVLGAIRAFEQASGRSLTYNVGPRRPGDAVEVYASVDKVSRELGWQAQLGIVEAMRDAWRWQQNLATGL